MGWTKRELVAQAFEEIGAAEYAYDIQAEQWQAALRRLDAMMATWNASGIRCGYALPSSPSSSSLDADSGLPDAANEAVYTNLAIRIAGTIGKQASMELKQTASNAYRALARSLVALVERPLPSTLPLGAGNRPGSLGSTPYFSPITDTVDAGQGQEITLE